MMAEEWKQIQESSGNYFISNYGRVMNMDTGKVLSPRPTKTGYLRVHLPVGKGRKDKYIHRLVADAFCKHPEGNDVVNHLDCNPANNRADNLEWTTTRGNIIYSMDAGRVERFPNAKQVVGEKDGKRYVFRSSHEAASITGCDHKTVLRCCKIGIRSSAGFLWKKVV